MKTSYIPWEMLSLDTLDVPAVQNLVYGLCIMLSAALQDAGSVVNHLQIAILLLLQNSASIPRPLHETKPQLT